MDKQHAMPTVKAAIVFCTLVVGCLSTFTASSRSSANGSSPGERQTGRTSAYFRSLDKSKMIPMRDPTYRHDQFSLKLVGSAISGNTPYEISYDTGSWTTSIPYGALNKAKLTVIEANVKDVWGHLADNVSGQLAVRTVDGSLYTLDNYVFFALKNPDGAPMPDDRTKIWGVGIMGAFPSLEPGRRLPPLPYAIAEKYAANTMGYGIVSSAKVSSAREDIGSQWDELKSYLQIGCPEAQADRMKWRTDIPLWHKELDFCPEAVPGFKIKIEIPESKQTIGTSDLMATIDTGAPDLTLRLDSGDPQYRAPFKSHFVKDGPWRAWNNPWYIAAATTLKNALVTVKFTDSTGGQFEYRFQVSDDINTSPVSLYAGSWAGDVPWPANNPDKPRNRINLGNTVYFFCPAVVYDIKNKRVGMAFK